MWQNWVFFCEGEKTEDPGGKFSNPRENEHIYFAISADVLPFGALQ
jgi:hypothetical protein